MSDLATGGAPEGTSLTDREGREVVVEHERLRGLLAGVDRVDALLVARRTECDDRERLGLTAREERRPVRPGEDTDLGRDRPDVVEATAVRTLPLVENLASHRLLLDRPQDLADVLLVLGVLLVLFGQRRYNVFGDRRHRLVALLFVPQVERLGDLRGGHAFDLRPQLRIGLERGPLHVGDRVPVQKLFLNPAQLTDRVVGDLEALQDLRLRDPQGSTLDHRDPVGRAGHDDVDVGVLELLERRVHHPRVLDAPHAHGSHQRVERDLRHVERDRSAE